MNVSKICHSLLSLDYSHDDNMQCDRHCKNRAQYISTYNCVFICSVGSLENFMLFLSGAQISISHAVTLAPDNIIKWEEIRTLADCQYIASNADTVSKVSDCLLVWPLDTYCKVSVTLIVV